MSKTMDFEHIDKTLNDPERLRAVETLRRITKPLSQVQGVLDELAKSLSAPFAAATFVDGNRQHFIATNDGPSEDFPADTSHCQYVIGTGAFICVNDADNNSLWRRLARALVNDKPLAAYLGFPLRFNGQVVGSVCVADDEPHEWTTHEQFEVYRASRIISDLLEQAKAS